MQNPETSFNEAFTRTVDVGNTSRSGQQGGPVDIAMACWRARCNSGCIRGQPCGDPNCEDCIPIATAEGRMSELRKLIGQFTTESDYFHTPHDQNVGRA